MPLPETLRSRLRLPVIGSPLFIVSSPKLVVEQCKVGIIGACPLVYMLAGTGTGTLTEAT